MVSNGYTTDFHSNTEIARKAEDITAELLEQIYRDVDFKSVHDERECFYKGDIKGTNGKYYEVKDCSCIHRTGNVFTEYSKEWNNGTITDGWIKSCTGEYLCVLDRIDHNLYVLDLNKLKRIYKNYRRVKTNMGDNYTVGYCVPLRECRKQGVLLYETPYFYCEEMDYHYIGKEYCSVI